MVAIWVPAAKLRLRPDGSIVPKNPFIQPAQNRTDVRFQQRVPLTGTVALDLSSGSG